MTKTRTKPKGHKLNSIKAKSVSGKMPKTMGFSLPT